MRVSGAGVTNVAKTYTRLPSYEWLMNPSTGPNEVAKFTSVIEGKAGVDFVDNEVRQCVWEQIVIEKESGRRDTRDREGPPLRNYAFTQEQEELMIRDLK